MTDSDLATPLGDGITAIDTRTAGLRNVTAGYLLDAPRPTLVECGPALSVDEVLRGLAERGLDADDLAYLVVTHIHLDHAGGAGDVLEAFPRAKVVVSEVGAPHLSAPERLNASSRRVYGPLMDTVYGECTPIDPDRVLAVTDGEVLDLGGGRRLEVLFTPGHAKHHIAVFDPDAGAVFAGDSVGVRMPGMATIRPATPPPDFDAVLATRSLRRYRERDPARVLLAHYGEVGPASEALEEAEEQLERWLATAASAWQEHAEVDHIAETLAARFRDDVASADPEARERVELLSGFESNAAGLLRYLELRAEGRVAT
ncbi:MAG: MBL fold metallo-hydrolase [Egibacteraceae bacterium]